MDLLKFKLEIVEALSASPPTNKSILTDDEDNSVVIPLAKRWKRYNPPAIHDMTFILKKKIGKIGEIGNEIEEVVNLARQINLERDGDGAQELLNFHRNCVLGAYPDYSQGTQREDVCHYIGVLIRYEEEKDDMLSRIVTGDETWVSHITPESNQQSME
ncbi:hypothetical protein TNCV_1771501 [Trichonephila clavipes]|nr:hypothetical protein TNCV_1771501 [Trichonephila clavipes]